MSCLSICIPRIEQSITKKYIALSFKNVGDVLRVDIVDNNRGTKKAFVHFTRCYENDVGESFKNIIMCGQTVKFVHSNLGWFWKCSKSRSARSA